MKRDWRAWVWRMMMLASGAAIAGVWLGGRIYAWEFTAWVLVAAVWCYRAERR